MKVKYFKLVAKNKEKEVVKEIKIAVVGPDSIAIMEKLKKKNREND